MPMSSRACPWAAPAVTSLRPSRLATRVAGAGIGSAGTVIPTGGVTSLFADAAPLATMAANTAPAATAPPTRRVLLLIRLSLPDLGRRGGCAVRIGEYVEET